MAEVGETETPADEGEGAAVAESMPGTKGGAYDTGGAAGKPVGGGAGTGASICEEGERVYTAAAAGVGAAAGASAGAGAAAEAAVADAGEVDRGAGEGVGEVLAGVIACDVDKLKLPDERGERGTLSKAFLEMFAQIGSISKEGRTSRNFFNK